MSPFVASATLVPDVPVIFGFAFSSNVTHFRRGRRQFLHPARWEEVRKTWLNHGIPSLVARKLEGTVDSGGWETL